MWVIFIRPVYRQNDAFRPRASNYVGAVWSFNHVTNADHGSANIQTSWGGVNDWNTLCTDNVNATSVNVFTRKTDKRLRRSSII